MKLYVDNALFMGYKMVFCNILAFTTASLYWFVICLCVRIVIFSDWQKCRESPINNDKLVSLDRIFSDAHASVKIGV